MGSTIAGDHQDVIQVDPVFMTAPPAEARSPTAANEPGAGAGPSICDALLSARNTLEGRARPRLVNDETGVDDRTPLDYEVKRSYTVTVRYGQWEGVSISGTPNDCG